MRLTILLCVILFGTATEWRRVDATAQAVYYVADERTDHSQGEVRVWEKIVPLDTDEGREYAEAIRDELERRGVRRPERFQHMTTRRRYKCGEGQAAFEQFIYHDRRGAVIARDPAERLMRWESPPPSSIAERLMLDACKRAVEMQ